ncbi:hypothetical protein JCM11641_007373 [Rhodosporidiobolus odoratus]
MWPFSRSSREVECWYCCSTLTLLPPTPPNNKGKDRAQQEGPLAVGSRDDFWCQVCGQITRRTADGHVVPDESAYFDTALNEVSLGKRASTSTCRLPPTFPTPQTTPFCRQCLANQSLQLHLLASYPSPSSDSDIEGEEAEDGEDYNEYPPLEEYKASLHARYPLVCSACAPQIEQTIWERDYKVKAQALGWRLRETERRREREERLGEKARRKAGRRWAVEGVAWKVRGGLWGATGLATMGWCFYALHRPERPSSLPPSSTSSWVLTICCASLLWSAWDPTWERLRMDRARGKGTTVTGREAYLTCQMLAFLLRLLAALLFRFVSLPPASARLLATVLFCASTIALASAFFLPRLSQPTPIRLTSSPSSSSLRSPPSPACPPTALDSLEPLAHLSLSRPGSILARSSPNSTPPDTPGGTRRSSGSRRTNEVGRRGMMGGIRPRIPSFSLGSIPWGRDLVSPSASSLTGEMDVDTSEYPPEAMAEDYPSAGYDGADENENSMDWQPLPPVSPPTSRHPQSTPTRSFPSTAHSANNISFARQRFVPPDLRKPTGLEGMFEKVGLREMNMDVDVDSQPRAARTEQGKGAGGWLSGLWTGGT